MSSVIQSINFSGNMAQLLKKRTREDNRLILINSVGLLFWILFCLFVLKPLVRGEWFLWFYYNSPMISLSTSLLISLISEKLFSVFNKTVNSVVWVDSS